ncbi:MAG: hypothetical protein WB766_20570 [Roseiarcus sp.]
MFSSNGDGFVFHDRTGASNPREANLGLDVFPSPAVAHVYAPFYPRRSSLTLTPILATS